MTVIAKGYGDDQEGIETKCNKENNNFQKFDISFVSVKLLKLYDVSASTVILNHVSRSFRNGRLPVAEANASWSSQNR